MSTEELKAIARREIEGLWNKGNLTVVDEQVANNFVMHTPDQPTGVRGPDALKQYVIALRTAFPDFHITIEDMVAEGEKIASRFTFRGTQKGELPGIPATGKQVTSTGIYIDHFEDGKLVETFMSMDTLSMLQQLGVIPPMG